MERTAIMHLLRCIQLGGPAAGLIGTEREVLYALVWWCAGHNIVFASNEQIADDLGISPQRVQRALGALVQNGWITRRQRRTDLTLLLGRIGELEQAAASNVAQGRHAGVRGSSDPP